MSFYMKKDIGQFMSGMKITIATARQVTGQKLDEGGRPILFDLYSKICEILYKGDDP